MPYEQPSRSELDRLNSQTTQTSLGETVHWILRVGAAGCFVGHGAFGIITKSDWLRYFAFAGIGHDGAYRLMPLIGSIEEKSAHPKALQVGRLGKQPKNGRFYHL